MMSYASCQAFAKKARELKSLDHVLMTAGILSFNRRESPEGWESCKASCPPIPSYLRSSLYPLRQENDTRLCFSSNPSQLPLHRPPRPPPTPTPQALTNESGPTGPHFRHHIRFLPLLAHHVCPQERLVP
jgi:hypothetical protein